LAVNGYEQLAEQRLTAQLKPLIQQGTALELGDPQTPFLAIYTPSLIPKIRGGVVIVPGVGEHADWPDVIFPLRVELSKYGWSCLSIQLPLVTAMPTSKNYGEYISASVYRIKTALEYLKNQGIYNILLAGHGLGATAGISFLTGDNGKDSGVSGVVAISMYPLVSEDAVNTERFFADNRIPMLDLYGSLDLDKVLTGVTLRARLAKKAGKKHYQRLQLTGADHAYTGFETTMIKRIRSWLDKYAPSIELEIPERTKTIN
jgi:hypothetical protein